MAIKSILLERLAFEGLLIERKHGKSYTKIYRTKLSAGHRAK